MKLNLKIKKITALFVAVVMLITIPSFTVSAISLPDDSALNGNSNISNPIDGKLYLSEENIYIDAGDTFQLDAFVSSSVSVLNATSFEISDSSIATVSNNGLVMGLNEGSAVITATLKGSGQHAKCTVKVKGSYVPPTTAPPTTQPTTAEPTTQPSTLDYNVTISQTSASVYKGCNFILKATSNYSLSWSSSNTAVATVDSQGMIKAIGAGTVNITASNGVKSASCKITVRTGSSVDISNTSLSFCRTESCLLESNDNVSWSSSDTSIATVNSMGVVYGQSSGRAVISAKISTGESTCVVNISSSPPLRFAYASPNSAPKGSTISLKAITDTNRLEVKFVISGNGVSDTVYATDKTTNGNTYIWTGYINLSNAGTYNVQAYSKYPGEDWATCDDASTTAFVTSATSTTETTNERRRASDGVIDIIANYESFLSDLTIDSVTGADPTVGYGKVINAGEVFYNHLTEREAYAYLVQTVNGSGYSSSVNTYLMNNNAKFNQRQFDALVCFTYNVGVYALPGDDDLASVFFNSSTAVSGSGSISAGSSGYVADDYVNLRSSPSTVGSIVTCMRAGTEFTLVSSTTYSGSGYSWYNIRLSDGTTGYVVKDYVTIRGGTTYYDLSRVDKDDFIYYFLQWHHAGGGCVWGLLYRRVDEAEMFLYGDYTRDGQNNKYGFSFACHSHPDFHL